MKTDRPPYVVKPQELVNTMYAFATLGRVPSKGTWDAMDAAVAAAAARGEMNARDVSNAMWWGGASLNKVKIGLDPRELEKGARFQAVKHVITNWFQEVKHVITNWFQIRLSNSSRAATTWACATLGKEPSDETR